MIIKIIVVLLKNKIKLHDSYFVFLVHSQKQGKAGKKAENLGTLTPWPLTIAAQVLYLALVE